MDKDKAKVLGGAALVGAGANKARLSSKMIKALKSVIGSDFKDRNFASEKELAGLTFSNGYKGLARKAYKNPAATQVSSNIARLRAMIKDHKFKKIPTAILSLGAGGLLAASGFSNAIKKKAIKDGK